jgi:NAD(P)-dependent dehydrogenase (short-subunit alcohol dehydrogenase family)
MTESKRDTQPSVQDVALIVGGGPGISSSCARLFAESGMRVCVAARNPEKAVLETLEKTHGVRRYACDASEPAAVMALETLRNSAFSAFLVGQQAARLMLGNEPDANGARGTIIFTNASAALKGFPSSGAFAMACHAKSGLAQSMARELMPQGIHVANVPIDAAIGWTQADGTRAHRLAGTTVDDNMADPVHIAKTYLQLHQQHRSTWAFEVVLRPWAEKW